MSLTIIKKVKYLLIEVKNSTISDFISNEKSFVNIYLMIK